MKNNYSIALQLFSSLLIVVVVCLAASFKAQAQKVTPDPLPVRIVSGIVLDSADNPVVSATVKLVSAQDSLMTTTDEEGIFRFSAVKSAVYTLSVSHLGNKPFVGRYMQNDTQSEIVMDPIVMRGDASMLQAVEIKAKPTITYKVDTVEFMARDYIVRKNASVDELLKQMQGMEVTSEGRLFYQGEEVSKAKLNGRAFLGGDVSNAIQNLPAEIVERIQVIDDYGDQAARTGVKSGESKKSLNIFTKQEKSVGNMLNGNGALGENNRYEAGLFGTRINGNRTMGLTAKSNQVLNGVGYQNPNMQSSGLDALSTLNFRSSDTQDGTSGEKQLQLLTASISDQLVKGIELNATYTFQDLQNDVLNQESGLFFSTLGQNSINVFNQANSGSKNHDFNLELNGDIGKRDFLRVVTSMNQSKLNTDGFSHIIQQGFFNQDLLNSSTQQNEVSGLGVTLFYQHFFTKPRRNISIQYSFKHNSSDNWTENESQNLGVFQKYQIERNRKQLQQRVSSTFVEPLNANQQLEFNAQYSKQDYDLRQFDWMNPVLSDYNYQLQQSRFSLNWRTGVEAYSKFNLSLGLSLLPYQISGLDGLDNQRVDIKATKLLPILRMSYAWTRQNILQLQYQSNLIEPLAEQIWQRPDITQPYQTIIGNPQLRASMLHSIHMAFNNFNINKGFTYNLALKAGVYEDAIVRDVTQRLDENGNVLNEIRYDNQNEAYMWQANLLLSKLLNPKLTLSYQGTFGFQQTLGLSNTELFKNQQQERFHRLKLQYQQPGRFTISPAINFLQNIQELALSGQAKRNVDQLSVGLDASYELTGNLRFGSSIAQMMIRGNQGFQQQQALLVNANLNYTFANRLGELSLTAYDLFNQNQYTLRSFTADSQMDKLTNNLSRYVMLKLSFRLQHWGAYKPNSPTGNKRRGDGSFI